MSSRTDRLEAYPTTNSTVLGLAGRILQTFDWINSPHHFDNREQEVGVSKWDTLETSCLDRYGQHSVTFLTATV